MNPTGSSRRLEAEIFLVSVLILFLELALIRWIGTEIRLFAHLGNLILVVCFFGVGCGCYLVATSGDLIRLGLTLLVLVALIANPLHLDWLDINIVTYLLSGFEDFVIGPQSLGLASQHILVGLILMAWLVALIVLTFVPAGQVLGRTMNAHAQPFRSYSVNIAGSLAGVWLFYAACWLSLPPSVWFVFVAVLVGLLAVAGNERAWMAAALILVAGGLAWRGSSSAGITIWSPYQKLHLQPVYADAPTNRVRQGYVMEVNGTFFQHMLDLSDAFIQRHADVFDRTLADRGPYNLPFCFKTAIQRMLIVGAGTGNNAAAALRHGVEQVDCVEIDPRIYALGQELHPERPYSSPRVRMILDDARAYFKKATGTYDVIWFGLLDAHAMGSSYSNLRLDHYVYTLESLREAKRLLAHDGLMIVNFSAVQPWVADRLFVLARDVFGQEPLAYSVPEAGPQYGVGGGNLGLVCSHTPVDLEAIADPALREFVKAHRVRLPGTTRPTTDDWPYLYLHWPKVPRLHLFTSLVILGTVLLAQGRVFGAGTGFDWHFFALGAAFLLLEVQTVSRATLLFGMTWIVNAIVISAVLVMILLANLVGARWQRLSHTAVVAGLAATVLAVALVPLDWFNTLTGATKAVAASAFLTAPVFFAGLIFIRSFAVCPDKSRALGSNLIGALVGGLLESLSFVTGIRALVVLVGLFYVAALWMRPVSVARQQT